MSTDRPAPIAVQVANGPLYGAMIVRRAVAVAVDPSTWTPAPDAACTCWTLGEDYGVSTSCPVHGVPGGEEAPNGASRVSPGPDGASEGAEGDGRGQDQSHLVRLRGMVSDLYRQIVVTRRLVVAGSADEALMEVQLALGRMLVTVPAPLTEVERLRDAISQAYLDLCAGRHSSAADRLAAAHSDQGQVTGRG